MAQLSHVLYLTFIYSMVYNIRQMIMSTDKVDIKVALIKLSHKEGWKDYREFILIIAEMMNNDVVIFPNREDRLYGMIKYAGRHYTSLYTTKTEDAIWREAEFAAMQIATWLNGCH